MSLDEISTLPPSSDKVNSQSTNLHDRFLQIREEYWLKVSHIQQLDADNFFLQIQDFIKVANDHGLKINHMQVLQKLLDAWCDPKNSGELIQNYLRYRSIFAFQKAESMINAVLYQQEDQPECIKLIEEAQNSWYDPYKCQELYETYMTFISFVRFWKAYDTVFSAIENYNIVPDCRRLIQEAFEAGYDTDEYERLLQTYNAVFPTILYRELRKTLKTSMIYKNKLSDYKERIDEVRIAGYSESACSILEQAYEKYFSRIYK